MTVEVEDWTFKKTWPKDIGTTTCQQCGRDFDDLMNTVCPYCRWSPPWINTDKFYKCYIPIIKVKIHSQWKEVFLNDVLIWEGREYDDKLLNALGYTVESEVVSAEAQQRGMI